MHLREREDRAQRAGRDALFPLGREGKKKQTGSSGALLCRIVCCPGRRRAGAGAAEPEGGEKNVVALHNEVRRKGRI